MKSMIKCVVAAVAMYAAGLSAAVLPRVGTGTTPNQWTTNISGVLAAAKTTNLPILLVMINDSSSGEGCQHCMQFVNRTLNTDNFAKIVSSYKFYMVLLNYWSSPSEPAYGGVSESVFMTYFNRYQSGDDGFPQVVLLKPDGTRHTVWSYGTRPVSSSGLVLYQYIDAAIAELSPNNTVLSLSAQSGNTVTVQSGVSAGVWTGVVTRSGGSGKTGTVSISLGGANKSLYRLSASSLSWDSGDGSKTFTVTGPASFDGGIVSDTLTVSISASGFSGSDVSYGTSSQTVTFKDSRVKQSLAEFAAANAGLGGLSSSGGTWFVPAQNDGNVLETVTSADSVLTFTATVGGILTAASGASQDGAVVATANGETFELSSAQPLRFGVAAGQKVVFKASANEGTAGATIGFSQFSFSPLSVTLSKPSANSNISYSAMAADKSAVDLVWASSLQSCTFTLTCNGVSKDMGSATSGNALDLGMVANTPATKSYTWSVRASYSADGVVGTAVGTASSAFTVAALPVYENSLSSVVAYKSVGASIDASVGSSEAGAVTYSATGLPAGMSINSSTGIITGSPKRTKSYAVTVTAKNAYGSTSTSFKLAVSKFPKEYSKPKYVLFHFNGSDEIVASTQFKVSTTGKWTAKIAEGGKTTTLKGVVTSLEDGSLSTGSSTLNLVYDAASGIWSGTASGRRVYGKAVAKADATWKGGWNFGVASSSSNQGGWVTAKVGATGQVSVKGKISNKTKISGKSYSAVFPASFIQSNLSRWAGRGNVRFGHACTRTGINVGCALFSDGSADGHVSVGSRSFDFVEGSRWAKSAVAGLNGKTLSTVGGGNVSVGVSASGTKASAKSNSYRATVRCTAASGQVTVSYKLNGASYKATGVAYVTGGTSKVVGGGTQGDAQFLFTIE